MTHYHQIDINDAIAIPFGTHKGQAGGGLYVDVDHICVDPAGVVVEIGWGESATATDPREQDHSLEAEMFRRCAAVLKRRCARQISEIVASSDTEWHHSSNFASVMP